MRKRSLVTVKVNRGLKGLKRETLTRKPGKKAGRDRRDSVGVYTGPDRCVGEERQGGEVEDKAARRGKDYDLVVLE